jgi:opine dehydrogenase
MRIAIIGAGNGGLATAAELALAGHSVALYARNPETLQPLQTRGFQFSGVFGEGRCQPDLLTTDLAAATHGADGIVVALPTIAHAAIARGLHAAGIQDQPVVLNPGHTGGLFEFETTLRRLGGPVPPLAAFSTLAYVARKPAPNQVAITGRAHKLRAACLHGGETALDLACALFPGAYDCGNVLASDLSNVNMIVHPPGAITGLSWVEATGGDFTFYVQGLTPAVATLMRTLDQERLAIAGALDQELPSVIGEMKAIGTVPVTAADDDYSAIAAGEANQRIKAPGHLGHRYYLEDFAHGLVPLLVYARIAGVEAPVATALLQLARVVLAERSDRPHDRDAVALGLEDADRATLLARARAR